MDAVKTGRLIVQIRKEKEMTQKDLGERLHVSVQAVSKWERGLNSPDIALLEPLAEALEITVSELLAGRRGEEPREELVRDSLRFGMEQLGPKIKRWRWLFALAALSLLTLVVCLGYVWLRDNTDLLPQRETTVAPVGVTDRERIMAAVLSEGKSGLYLYEAALADDLSAWTIRIEVWANGKLEESRHLLGAYAGEENLRDWSLLPREKAGASAQAGPRKQLLALSLTPEWAENPGDASLGYTLCFDGWTASDTIEHVPYMTSGWMISDLKEKTSVDSEEGVTLLVLSVDGQDGRYHRWGTTSPEGSAFLVFKLYCR